MTFDPSTERRRDQYEQRFQRIDDKLDGIGESLVVLARIDERHMNTTQQLIEVVKTQNEHERRLGIVEKAIPDDLTKRVGEIEKVMPGLRETRGWVISGILAGLAMMGVALSHVIMK